MKFMFSVLKSRVVGFFGLLALTVVGGAILIGSATAAKKTYVIKVTDEVAVNSALNASLTAWQKMVEKDTKGQVKVDLYPAGQLLSDADSIPAIQQGTIQMNVSTTGRMASIVPALKVFDFPYLISTGPQLRYFLKRKLGQLLNQQLEAKGVRAIAIWPLTGRIVIATSKPITSYRDLHGLNIRIYGSDAQAAALKALGANGVIVQPSEIATAIATHVVDGIATGMAYWWQNYHQSLPYAIYTGMWSSPYAVWMNNKFWKSLPAKLQKVILADLAKAKVVGAKIVAHSEKGATSSGHVTGLSNQDRKVWETLTASVPSQYVKTLGPAIVKAASDPRSR